MLGNEEHFHTKPSRREEERFKKESKWQRKQTVHRDFTLETQPGKPTVLECSSLLFSNSFRIKCYMPNIGLHPRQNLHRTFFLYTRTTLYPILSYICMTNNLYDFIIIYSITTCLIYSLYNRKNPKEKAPKNGYRYTHIIGYKYHESRDYVTVDYQVGLPVNYQSTFIRYSVCHHMPTCRPFVGWPLRLDVDLFDFEFTE